MAIFRYALGPMDNNCYLVLDEATQEAALIDPSFDSEKIWDEIVAKGYRLRYVLNTHAHFDHVVGNAFFVEKSGALLGLHRADLDFLKNAPEHAQAFGFEAPASPEPTLFLEDGQEIALGETRIQVVHTPGHAPGHVTFLLEDSAIVGDCLFARSIGRTDLPMSSYHELMDSIRTRLLVLPDETKALPGHGATTTIGRERRSNPYLQGL